MTVGAKLVATVPNKQKDYLSTRDAAELLNVAVSTIQLWTDNGFLRAWTTAGGHRRIAKSAVDEMLYQQQSQSNKKSEERPLSIVVVEDNEHELMLYEQQFELSELNADVHISKDGYAGLINIGKTSPDIIITDLMMPNMNGFEMINAIKENPELVHCLIMVVSALSKDEIRIRGGLPDDVVVFRKPLTFNELENLIRQNVNSNVR